MENSNQDEEMICDVSATNKKKVRKPRGPSKGLKSISGVQRVIQWDELGRPTGPWKGDYKKHVGEISRAKVSILIKNWNDVPQGIKDTLWEDTKREFQIDDNEEKKSIVLSACDKRWRDFKTRLVSGWITRTRYVGKNPQPPYETYSSFLTKEIWEEFVKQHEDEKFKEKSEKARASQLGNKYPHYMGQKSYAEMIPMWRSKGYMPSQSSSISTGSSYAVSSLPPRTYPWILARSKEDEKGNLYLPDESTKLVKAEIDMWRDKERSGEFVPSRLDDALSRALKKKDRSGRVLAVGGNVGIRTVWGPADRKGGSRSGSIGAEELKEFEERVSQRVRQETMDEVNAKIDDMVKEKFMLYAQAMGMQLPNEMIKEPADGRSNPDAQVGFGSSCHSGGHDPFEDLEEPTSCLLAIWIEGKKQVVAEGCVSPIFKAASSDNVVVSVDDYTVEYGDAPVPVPTETILKVKHAHGAFVDWPKVLVLLSTNKDVNQNEMSPKKKQKGKEVGSGPETNESAWLPKKDGLLDLALETMGEHCHYMYKLIGKLEEGGVYTLMSPAFVFKYTQDQEIHISYDDAMQLLTGAWLNISILQVFQLDLYDWAENACIQSIGFMCPYMISETMIMSDPDDTSGYMQQAIRQQQGKRFILCPYHQKNHWLLLVLSPCKREVYIFDPLKKKKRNLKIRFQLENAFRSYKYSEGQSSRTKLTWKEGECAQQSGGVECGYYVMRYMLEIVENFNESEDLIADYIRTKRYTDQEINEIRERFAEYFVGNLENY